MRQAASANRALAGTLVLLFALVGAVAFAQRDGPRQDAAVREGEVVWSRRTQAARDRARPSVGKNFSAFLARREAKGGGRAKEGVPLWQRVADVSTPLRLIYGREDRGRAAERVALARERHPHLDIHLVPGARHLVQWDAPAEFARLVGDFLAA